MGIQLKVINFRCLRNVDWSPDGVCVLVGPNGSGKTTLFEALNFLRLAYVSDLNQAIVASGGRFFRHLDAAADEAVSFSLTQGTCTWTLSIPPGGGPFQLAFGETLTDGPTNILTKRPGEPVVSLRGQPPMPWQGGVALRAVMNMPIDQFPRGKLEEMIATLNGCLVYGSYAVQKLRQSGSPLSSDLQLSPNGQNAFVVLRNWLGKWGYRPAYNIVLKQLRDAFPGVADELSFDDAGQITSISLVDSRRRETIPVAFAPHGWLAGLLHLMAVAGAEPGTVVMIDEFENSLHPYAIRLLVRAMREWAAKKQLAVILAGHSSALLDEFGEDPSRVFVMEPWHPGQPSMPLRLTDYRDPEWLKHFSLGELYRHDDFGGPKDGQLNSVPAMSTSGE